jgi:hypothetical protein
MVDTPHTDPKPAPIPPPAPAKPAPHAAPLTREIGVMTPVEPPPYVLPPLKEMQIRLVELMIKYGANSDPVKLYKAEIASHPDSKPPAPVVPAPPKPHL